MICTEQDFLKRVKDHELKILHEQGLYRHLQFNKPGTMIDGFYIITWPGFLAYVGDMGDFVFQRTSDMLTFFRHEGINPGYWSEKVVAADREGVTEYTPGKFREVIRDCLEDCGASPELREAVEEQVLTCADEGEYEARNAVEGFGYVEDSGLFRFNDFWEYDLTEYTYRFLFCCYALVWGIRKYDERTVK